MNARLIRHLGVGLILGAAGCAQAQSLPMEPPHFSGQSITGAYEGWFSNPDGSFSMLLGYFNRNTKEALDIPIGPDNRIDPGGPDHGQPTHFLPGRMWGEFTIKASAGQKFTWTIVANGKTTVIPINLSTDWEVSPFVDGTGNSPPYIAFSEAGPFVNGPGGQSTTLTAGLSTPMLLTVWVADDAHVVPGMRPPGTPAVTLAWSKFRGPGDVKFANERPVVEKAEFAAPPKTTFQGKSTTFATFTEPGEYVLRVVANDWTLDGGRGFQCCWTNAQLRVTVKAR